MFKAYIGGDDFFSAVETKEDNENDFIENIQNIINIFKERAKEFYSQEDKDRGFIKSIDRDERSKKFPLFSVSASLVILHKNKRL